MLVIHNFRQHSSFVFLLCLMLAAACDGRRGEQGPPGPPGGGGGGGGGSTGEDEFTDTELERGEKAPQIVLELLAVHGASGADGSVQVGDRISVDFRFAKEDGAPWLVEEMSFGRILLSGPTFNYQRVIAEREDLLERASEFGSDVLRYTFEEAIPAKYLPPYNSTGGAEGDWAGQALLSGTYTLALAVGWRYNLAGEARVEVGEASIDLLFLGATVPAPRAVSAQANCNACHTDLSAHQGERRALTTCLLCHTAGAEDANLAEVGDGTPGVSIDSRVLFHKIHNAVHLPSVLGVGVSESGAKDYSLKPRPLLYALSSGSSVDHSAVGFPVWPNRSIPMLRDFQYSTLNGEARAKEDSILRGVTSCTVCHGDPDGAGPLESPADGELIYTQPARASCGACHDDVDWSLPYTSNAQTMPPQPDSSQCKSCHEVEGGPLAVRTAHLHPLYDPFFNPGLRLEILAAEPALAHDGDKNLDPGEGLRLRLTLRNDAGDEVDPATLDQIAYVFSGPTSNFNLVAHESVAPAMLQGLQPFELLLPERIQLEYLGDSTSELERFLTERTPHFDLAGAETVVFARLGTGIASELVQDMVPGANRIDLLDATGFARDDWIVIADGQANEEYVQVQHVEANTLWLSSPADLVRPRNLRFAHPPGTSVATVTLQELIRDLDYSLEPASGEIRELRELGNGRALLAGYTTHWRLPERFGAPLNDSTDIGEDQGEWSGKVLVSGTYSLTLTASREADNFFAGEHNLYALTSPAASVDLLVGSATTHEPYDLISSSAACLACHQELHFHEGRARDFVACIACHGTAGAEDRPRYVAANAPATPARSIGFRSLLHQIHMGAALSAPQELVIVGAGSAPWPDNFSAKTYDFVHFPAQPDAQRQCTKCHGAQNDSWIVPAARAHPDGQAEATRAWAQSCATCHDSPAAQAHVDSQTTPEGQEACAICHGPGEEWSVELYHPK